MKKVWLGATILVVLAVMVGVYLVMSNINSIVAKVIEAKGAQGFDAATGSYCDLVKAGIIDPALVSRTALLNAASVAGLMLTTDVIVAELKEDDKPVANAVS